MAKTADDHLRDARDALNTALKHHSALAEAHDDGNYQGARRALVASRRAVTAAKESVDSAAKAVHDYKPSTAGPSEAPYGQGSVPATMGAQTSAGQSPRSTDPEAIRKRDQLSGAELCYRERMRQGGGRR